MVVLKCKTNNNVCYYLYQKDKYIWLRFLGEHSTFRTINSPEVKQR